jgi:hypothetical protein
MTSEADPVGRNPARSTTFLEAAFSVWTSASSRSNPSSPNAYRTANRTASATYPCPAVGANPPYPSAPCRSAARSIRLMLTSPASAPVLFSRTTKPTARIPSKRIRYSPNSAAVVGAKINPRCRSTLALARATNSSPSSAATGRNETRSPTRFTPRNLTRVPGGTKDARPKRYGRSRESGNDRGSEPRQILDRAPHDLATSHDGEDRTERSPV